MHVFGQFELFIFIFLVGLLNTKGDMQALSSFSLNCSDHKLTQLLTNLPVAGNPLACFKNSTSWNTHADMSDVLLQCLRSISTVVNPVDHGLVLL